MIPDVLRLYEALQYGSSLKAHGSRLFDKIREDAKSVENNPLLKTHIAYLAEKKETYRHEIPALSYQDYIRFDTTGDRRKYEAAYFERRDRLMVYAFSVWLWNKSEDIHALEDTIWAICDEYSWCLPAHMAGKSLAVPITRAEKKQAGILMEGGSDNAIKLDLFACETGFALAECCAMLEGVLSPLVVERARNEAYRRLIKSYLENGGLQHWELLEMNWCAVCAGSLAGAACYLIEDDLFLGGILHKLIPTLDRFLNSFSADGACIEGLSYWTYGVSFFVDAADLIYRRTGGKIDLFQDPRFEKIALFQQACYLPGGAIINYSDARDTGFSLGLTGFLKKRFPGVEIPSITRVMKLNHDDISHFAPALRDLLWSPEEPPVPPAYTATTIFPNAQWLISTAGDTAFTAKGGHNDEPHNHNDVGTFIYYKKGKMIFADLGSGFYIKDYFNENRYTIFCNQSLSHSLPIIAGQGQKPGRDACATDCSIAATAEMSLDIAPAYGIQELASLKRRYAFDRTQGNLKLEDHFVFQGASLPVTERFVSLYPPKFKDGLIHIDAGDAQGVLKCSLSAEPLITETDHHSYMGTNVKVFLVDYSFVPNELEFRVNFEII
ncbi:heparinase [Spirochaetia bacterium]|nr:heparinase [Spirochaetia bacterium]